MIVSDWFPISPTELRAEDIEFRESPLLVLNACESGKLDPFQTCDLVSELLDSEIQGMLATECQVPDAFAAAFMKEFYRRLLKEHQQIGHALKSCREYFWGEYNNPLGLLYSLYQIDPRWQLLRRPLTAN
jgi:CHAT domain-containing protein